MVERIIAHPKIQVLLGADAAEVLPQLEARHLFYTGPIDAFYAHRFGSLPYRSLRFERDTYEQEFHQPAVQVNYPNEHTYTRTVEVKHVTGQKIPVTTVLREYPEEFNGINEPYYPILTDVTRDTYRKYAALAEREERVTLVGRLGTYQYYNMDQVVAQALHTFEKVRHRVAAQPVQRYMEWKRAE
jgi:UDP-galactopyranose mutase